MSENTFAELTGSLAFLTFLRDKSRTHSMPPSLNELMYARVVLLVMQRKDAMSPGVMPLAWASNVSARFRSLIGLVLF